MKRKFYLTVWLLGVATGLAVAQPQMVVVHGGTLDMSMGTVAVRTFEIGRFEVTWAQWQELRDWAVAHGYDLAGVGAGCAADHPVHSVNWYDVLKACNALSERDGLTPVYTVAGAVYRTGQTIPQKRITADGYRLPTVEEREFAARGGTLSAGYTYSGSNNVGVVAWYVGNAGGAVCGLVAGHGTWPVGKKLANELGLHDMSGNVWEWCWHVGEIHGRVGGGSFSNTEDNCRVDSLAVSTRSVSIVVTGFRLARNAAMVPVGNPANVAHATGLGSVPYSYRIGRYEVTNAEYTAFLNAVAATDTHYLYSTQMSSSPDGGITRSGSSGSHTYATKPGMENRPVNFHSFWSAARYANWLTNGQPTGAQGPGTTESGVYALNGVTSPVNSSITRDAAAFAAGGFAIASDDEWYKAASHDPALHAGLGGYYLYATSSDTAPTAAAPTELPNHANLSFAVGHAVAVGSYPGSPSPYGTFDQNGNVWDRTEGLASDASRRNSRGGVFDYDGSFATLSTNPVLVSFPYWNVGFRITQMASLPVASAAGSALAFDGATMSAETSLSDAPGTYGEALTIEAWVRRNAAPAGIETILAKGTDWILRMSDGDLEFVTAGLTPPVQSVAVDLADNAFHHLAAVYDRGAGTKALFLDGVVIATSDGISGDLADTSSLFRIAADAADALTPEELWRGSIAEVRIWNVVRDAGQLAAMRHSRLYGHEFGLVHLWRLDEGRGATTADGVAGGNALTLAGGPVWFAPSGTIDRLRGVPGTDLAVQLGGGNPDGGTVTFFITGLPEHGTLYQREDDGWRGDAIVLSAGEAEVIDPDGRVIYAAPESLVSDDPLTLAEAFDTIRYLVRTSGGGVSGIESVTIDLESASVLGGSVIVLDGVHDYVMTPNLSSGFRDNAVTIEVWFNADGPGVLVQELGQAKIDSGWHDSQIELVDLGGGEADVRVRVWNLPEATPSTLTTGLSLGTVNFGEWNHVALRYNPVARRLDGALNGVPSAAQVSGDRQAPWEAIVIDSWNQASRAGVFYAFGARTHQHLGSGGPIGTRENNSLAGRIDEVRIWNEAIPDDRLARDSNRFLPGETDRLVALYRFDEPGGTLVREATDPARNATATAGCTRARSILGPTLIEVDWVTAATIALPGHNDGTPVTTAWITRLPLAGALYQVGADGAKGERIARTPTEVTDIGRRVLYEPVTGSRFDSFEYETRHGVDVYGPRRIRLRVNHPNTAPVFRENHPIPGGLEGTPLTITYEDLATALDPYDADGDPLRIRIERVTVGELTLAGQPVVERITAISPGEELEWTPPPHLNNENHGGAITAFVVVADDGRDRSNPATVSVELAPVESAPVARYPGLTLGLDGAGAHAITPNLRSLFRTDSLTIEVWFRADGPGVLVSELGNTAGTGWHCSLIELVDAGAGQASVRATVYNLLGGAGLYLGEVSYGTWNHAVVRFDEAHKRLDGFLNGVSAAEPLVGHDRSPPWRGGHTSLHYAFGRADTTHLGNGSAFHGLLHEVRIWNFARSTGAIRAAAPGELTGDERGLVAWYRFNDSSIRVVTDYGPYRPGGPLSPVPGLANLDAILSSGAIWARNPMTATQTDAIIRLQGYHPDGLDFGFRIEIPPLAGRLFQFDGGGRGVEITAMQTVVTDPGGRIVFSPEHLGHGSFDTFSYVAIDFLPRIQVSNTAEVTVWVENVPEFVGIDVNGPDTSGGPGWSGQRDIVRSATVQLVEATGAGLDGISILHGQQSGGEAPELRLEFTIPHGEPFTVEYSDDLESWHPVPEVFEDAARSTPEGRQIVAMVDTGMASQRFLRVRLLR